MADPWAEFRSAAPASADPWADFRGGASSVEDGRVNTVTVRPAAPSGWDNFKKRAEGLGKALDVGAAHMVAGTAGAAGDIANLGAMGIQAGTNAVERFAGLSETPDRDRGESMLPTSESMLANLKKNHYGGEELYKPQNTAEEYAKTTGEFLLGGVGGAGRRIVSRLGQVLIPAGTSETAGQVTKGKAAEPYARFGGALVGGGVAGLASRPGNTAQAIRQQLPEGVTPQMVDQAEALIQHAGQQGIQLAWPEALSQVAGRPVLTNMMRHLEASPQTEAQMGQFFGARPQQVERAARQQFDNIGPANRDPYSIGPAVGREAEGHVNDVRGMINTASEPYYAAAAQTRIAPAEMARARAVPGYDAAVRAIQRDPQLARYVQGMPEDSVGFLNEVKKWLDQAAENAGSAVTVRGRNMQRQAGFSQDATTVRETAVRASPDYDTALAIQSGGRERILQPILDGPIGKLASRDTTTSKAIEVLFPSGKELLAGGEQQIGDAVRTLANRNPRVATDLVRGHVEMTFNQTAKDLQTGANQAGGAKFRTQLVGNRQQAANLEAAVTALPNGAERWTGFNRFLEVLEATGTRQGIGSRTAYNVEINKGVSAGGLVADTVKTGANPMRMGQKYVDKYEQWKLGKNLGQLADILTDPRAANQLRAIARMPNGSAAATSMALKLITYAESSK